VLWPIASALLVVAFSFIFDSLVVFDRSITNQPNLLRFRAALLRSNHLMERFRNRMASILEISFPQRRCIPRISADQIDHDEVARSR
jgi:hypothetical protein